MIRFAAGATSDVGRVRTVNEDALLLTDDLFAVADGMGGHRGGDVASTVALAAFRQYVLEPTVDALIEAVQRANRAVIEQSLSSAELSGMGTTLCAISVVREGDRQGVAVVNVGDSRVYLFSGGELRQLSEDHSLVETMVREGQLSADEAAHHPRRNVLTRALGIDSDVDVDCWQAQPEAGDRFLLCSDGLFNELSDDQIAAVLRRLADPQEAADELVRLANEGGGRDNITVLVVDVQEDDSAGAEPSLIGTRVVRVTDPVEDPLGLGAPSPGDDGDAPAPEAARWSAPAGAGAAGRWRVVLFSLAIAAVFGLALAAIAWTARSTYYVAEREGLVAIYQGRSGGLLWFRPTFVESGRIHVEDLPERQQAQVRAQRQQPDLAAARDLVRNLALSTSTTTTTTTGPTTSTTTTPAAPTVPPAAAPPGG